jgi:hypothetical protein
MGFISLHKWTKLNEGGNAIKQAERLTYNEALELLDFISENILPKLNITKNDISLIGSFGKKPKNK